MFTQNINSMEQPQSTPTPSFLEEVYQLNEGRDVMEALVLGLQQIDALDIAQLKRIGLNTYAEGKWSIHTLLQHLIDWERIWCFRAVLFARREGTTPDAHDQEIMARHCNADERSLDSLVEELRIVRQSTIMQFRSYNEDILQMNCVFFDYEMPLHALGLSITAHQVHHFRVLKERYLPLDS